MTLEVVTLPVSDVDRAKAIERWGAFLADNYLTDRTPNRAGMPPIRPNAMIIADWRSATPLGSGLATITPSGQPTPEASSGSSPRGLPQLRFCQADGQPTLQAMHAASP